MSLVDTVRAMESPGDVRERNEGYAWKESSEKVVERDGYVRLSPVQPLFTPPEYHRRIVRKIIGILAAVAVILLVVWYLLKKGDITI